MTSISNLVTPGQVIAQNTSEPVNQADSIDPQPPVKPQNPITLNAEQKAKVLGLINANPKNFPALKELTQAVFGGNFDGRSFEGKAVKEYCATLNIKPKSSFDPKYSHKFELSDEHKLYIRNNSSTLSPIEMARALFNIQNAHSGTLEVKLIFGFLKEIGVPPFDPQAVTFNPGRFIPKTLDQAARRVNKYVLNAVDAKNLKKDARAQNYLQALVRYCHKTRYAMMIQTLAEGIDLELFESTFISNVWDKPDLSEEEIDQYINLASDIVNHTKMLREVEKLSEMRDKCLDDSDGKRLSMALVAQMGELYKEMDNNLKRQNATTKALIGTRNDRLEGLRKGQASVSQLVETWRDKQKRERMIALAEKRKELVREEVDRLDTLDAFKIEIFGLNKESF